MPCRQYGDGYSLMHAGEWEDGVGPLNKQYNTRNLKDKSTRPIGLWPFNIDVQA